MQVLGEWVGLKENAFIDVSGDLGGGTALIGGDYQGKGIVPNAEKTYFHSTAFVTADALSSGDGGRVILWADDATYFMVVFPLWVDCKEVMAVLLKLQEKNISILRAV